ncbi:MAG TPA: helix-turn-helix domain-containing protein [Thermoleophilaceae bacterium]|nr:helix-turn-helix domain-containing protein [Thermoleophilaceae bacterium]
MSGPVKSRSYDSRRRREQAAQTRREILDAAERLFVADGYVATTIAAIAKDAGVATKTVYLAFETKSGVLRALWNLRLRGDQDEIPVAQRTWYLEVLDEPDPERTLRLNARNARAVKERVGALLAVVREAAAVDPDSAALWDRIQTEFHENQGRVVATLDEAGALRPGLDAPTATDILWTLNHPEVWQILVGRRGWTPARWEEWLAESSRQQLLGR